MNIAATMESTSEPMKVQISETTQRLLDPNVFCTEYRGTITVPRLGEIKTYWLSNKKLEPIQHVIKLTKTVVPIGKVDNISSCIRETDQEPEVITAVPEVTKVAPSETQLANTTIIIDEGPRKFTSTTVCIKR